MAESTLAVLIVALIAFFGTLINLKETWRLTREVHKLSIGLGQRVQRLHRAQELVTSLTVSTLHIIGLKSIEAALEPTFDSLLLNAKHPAKKSELLGLMRAIKDKKLLEIMNSGYHSAGEPELEQWKKNVLRLSTELHTRISELLIEETEKGD